MYPLIYDTGNNHIIASPCVFCPCVQDPEAKIKARQDIVAGPLAAKFKKLTELVVGGG
jgi:hypothetical protein